tara:strand:+ start:252 stop:494 length:243 start_codon:yes stop_codon:yes gene_type:complete
MTINSTDEIPSSDTIDFNDDDSKNEFDNNVADFDLNTAPTEGKNSRHSNKRKYLAKKKIEQLQEERRLRKLDEDYYGDWD